MPSYLIEILFHRNKIKIQNSAIGIPAGGIILSKKDNDTAIISAKMFFHFSGNKYP
jgi:hypothetical protein